LENIQISNFIKIRPVGAELFHADGRMGIKKPAVTSRNFGNVPNRRNVLGNKVVSTVPKRLRFHVTQHSGMPITKIPH